MNGKFQFDKTLDSITQNEAIWTALRNVSTSRKYSGCCTSMLENILKSMKN